jgi:hypothetical protein
MRAAIILADFAQTDPAGKVHIVGAGWSVTGPQIGPQAVVGFIQVPAEEGPSTLSFVLRLSDLQGNLVEVPGPAGMQPMELGGQVEVQEPDEWDRESDLNAAVSVNVLLPLPIGHSYTWSLEVNGKELATTTFYVRSAAPRASVEPKASQEQPKSLPSPRRVVPFLPALQRSAERFLDSCHRARQTAHPARRRVRSLPA